MAGTPHCIITKKCSLLNRAPCLIFISLLLYPGNLAGSDTERIEIPIGRDLSHLFIPVRLKCGRAMFLVDTGAVSCVLDRSLLPFFEPLAEVPNGKPYYVLQTPIDIAFGPFSVRIQRAAFVDLTLVREAQELPVMGILGIDVLRQFCLTLSSDRAVLILSKADPGHNLPFRRPLVFAEGGRPFVLSKINGLDVPIMIDTGSMGGLCVKPEIFKDVVLELTEYYVPQRYVTIGGVYVGKWFGEVPGCQFGDLKVPITLAENARDSRSPNAIGLASLCRMNICLDFPNEVMRFGPSRLFSGVDSSDDAGLIIGHKKTTAEGEQGYRIEFVRSGSVAERAGLQPNDLIYRIEFPGEGMCEGSSLKAAIALPRVSSVHVHVVRGKERMVRVLPGREDGR